MRRHAPLLLLAVLYGVSCFFAVDRERALIEAVKMPGILLIALFLGQLNVTGLKRMLSLWVWTGAALAVWGIAFGLERNSRLESTLDYANALAILLLASILAAALLYIRERKTVLLLPMAASVTGLLLTLSRSVWVLWLVSALIVFLFFPSFRSKRAAVGAGIAHLCGMAAAMLLRGDPLFFWQRVQSIQPQTSEFHIRLVYWRDSLGMIRDYPWFGSGGGGWAMLLPSYRSQDYFVRFVHNHYLQIALDAGLIALIAFLAWIAAAYVNAFRTLRNPLMSGETLYWTSGCLLIFTVLLLHAGFDFDFSFPLLFALLACMHAAVSIGQVKEDRPAANKGMSFTAATVILLVCGAAVCGWLGVGYAGKQAGIALASQGRTEDAQIRFAAAGRLLPWAHTVRYEAAKAYARAGNASGDMKYYRLAEQELDAALRLAPREDLYQSLRIDLNKALHNQ